MKPYFLNTDLLVRSRRIIEALPRDAPKKWREASSRIFDIGLQSGDETQPTHWTFPRKH